MLRVVKVTHTINYKTYILTLFISVIKSLALHIIPDDNFLAGLIHNIKKRNYLMNRVQSSFVPCQWTYKLKCCY